ncbi:MAG: hypothetical protein LBL71_02610, partial [Endomicrobium sp.]|nr:hypothetical protein [Endomicrobium sp.]
MLDNKNARKNANVIFVADTSKLFISNRKELEKGGKNNKSGAENAEPGTSQKLSGNTENELEEKERYYNAKEKVIEREVVFEQSLKDIFNSYIEYR